MTLAEHLQRPGRTYTEWAALADVSVATISRWASGKSKPAVQNLPRLSTTLSIPRHELRPDLYDAPPPRHPDAPASAEKVAAE